MTAVEARVREALHDVVDHLGVTDDDIARMEGDLFTAVSNRRRPGGVVQRRRRWALVAAAAVLAAAVAGALAVSREDRGSEKLPARPPTSDRPLVPPELVGAWRAAPDGRGVWVFASDGGVGTDGTAADYLEDDFSGRILARFGNLYTVHTEDGCDETVRIRIVAPGSAALSGQRTTCDPKLGPETEETLLERISPQPFLGGLLSKPAPSEEPGFVRQSTFIDGVWLHVDSGTLLGIGRPRQSSVLRYSLDDDGDGKTRPDQRGRVIMSQTGPPVFRPDATTEKPDCALAFTSLSILRGTMTTTSAGGGCLPTGSQTWVRISS